MIRRYWAFSTLSRRHYVAKAHQLRIMPVRGAVLGPDLLGLGATLGERHGSVVFADDFVTGVAFNRSEPGVPDELRHILAMHRARGSGRYPTCGPRSRRRPAHDDQTLLGVVDVKSAPLRR